MLAEAGDDAKVLAGGQGLLPILRMRATPRRRWSTSARVDELRGVSDGRPWSSAR